MVVLNVDDDSDNLEMFCEAVKEISPSIDCIRAESAEEALAILDKSVTLPDYIFLDMNMPLMDGKSCLKKIRGNIKLSDITVVMLSSSSDRNEIEECKHLGARFLRKEASHWGLVEALRKVIGERRASNL